MTELRFIVPGPPRPWARAASRNGQRFTPKEMREYQAHVAFCASVVKPSTWPKDREYALSLHVVFPDKRRRDLSNVVKTVEDACNELIWDDDSQIACIRDVTRSYDKQHPRVEVEVTIL